MLPSESPELSVPPLGPSTAMQIRSAELSTFVLPPPVPPPVEENEEVHFRDLWRVIVKRKWTVILLFLTVEVTTLVATFLLTPIFRPGITLKIERDVPKVIEFKDVMPVESQGDRDFYQTQYELLKSRTLAERVIEQLSLRQYSELKT